LQLYTPKKFKDKKLIMGTTYGYTTYYIYRDEQMGFEYDLAKKFAEFLGFELVVKICDNDKIEKMLKQNEIDFIANNYIKKKSKEFLYSIPYSYVDYVIVTHKKNHRIKYLKDLNGKVFFVRKNSNFEKILKKIRKEASLDFKIVYGPDISDEEYIKKVNDDDALITVTYSNLAESVKKIYPKTRIRISISNNHPLVWVTNKKNKWLIRKMNKFISQSIENNLINKLLKKYIQTNEDCDCFDINKFLKRMKTRFPKYEKYIKTAAKKYNLDWRLITALTYQESHFNPNAKSHTGVKGLMQLTLDTAKRMGVTDRLNPAESINGGTKYLKMLMEKFNDIENEKDKLKYALAAYNLGLNHVYDAMKLAKKLGKNPKKWEDVATTLILLSDKKYYRQTEYGYCRGWEAVSHVKNVLNYYDILRKQEIIQKTNELHTQNVKEALNKSIPVIF
jgi:membrane-bound lytic murein transglycosylase F